MASSPSGKDCKEPICNPPCKGKEQCIVSVISNIGECAVAKCAIVSDIVDGGNNNNNNNTGGDNNNNNKNQEQESKGSSVLGPVLGSLLGVAVVGLAVFLFLRRRRQRRRTNDTHLLHSSSSEESTHSFSSKSPYGLSSEMAGHRDVIRIAYIPSMISDTSPIQLPPQAAGGDTSVLEAATVTTVTQNKATPQVMRLNTIKKEKSDLIQRSNSLHSNNSLKRSKSQRQLAKAREKSRSPLASAQKSVNEGGAAGQPRRNSPTTGLESDSDEDDEDEDDGTLGVRCDGNDAGSPFRDTQEPIEYTPAVMVTGPSARSSMRSTSSGQGGGVSSNGGVSRPRSPTMVLGPLPIDKTQSHTMMTTSSANSTSTIVVTPNSKLDSSMTIHRGGGEEYDDDDDPLSLLDIQGAHRLRPWARGSMASGGTRDSTFSTSSDARSSTRGDGEEIMIFWDGHRNSTRSSVNEF
ncbi:hypothetical protein BGW42_006770 [Actinomortierella wolfii]|nr:hypothetical protein BGW42_006770 [Actinomortierella wolfii]